MRVEKNGDVYSDWEKKFKPSTSNGYAKVVVYLKEGRKYKLVHRLVAETYLPNPERKPCVNHKDGNKLNNNLENLEWVTHSENTLHAIRIGIFNPSFVGRSDGEFNGRAKLTNSDVFGIRRLLKVKKITQQQIANGYNVNRSQISGIKRGTTWGSI